MCAPTASDDASAAPTPKENPKETPQEDPHDIQERFVNNHQRDFPRALREIKNGKKESCWLWWILPAAPYTVNGVEKGSTTNRKYALRGDEAVEAFLSFKSEDGTDLRQNYFDIVSAIYKQMKRGKSLRELLGDLDDVKVVSSLELFAHVAEQMEDNELAFVCRNVLELYAKYAKKRAKNSRKIPGLKKLLGLKKSAPQRYTSHF